MKLRLQRDSVRFRLSEAEAQQLAFHGRIEESVSFGGKGGGTLVYEIVAGEGVEEVAAAFSDGRITVAAPRSSVKNWALSGDVALSGRNATDGEDGFRIIIEKDLGRRRPERA